MCMLECTFDQYDYVRVTFSIHYRLYYDQLRTPMGTPITYELN